MMLKGRPEPNSISGAKSPVAEDLAGEAIAGKSAGLVHAAEYEAMTLVE